MRKLLCATVSAALCGSSLAPAMAQDYRFSTDAPRGATATVNLRVPLGARRAPARPSYGLSFGYGQTVGSPAMDGRTISRGVNVADIRFSGGELRHARVASFDLAHLDRDRRMNLTGGGSTTWIIIGAVAGAVAACLVLDCFDGDDEAMPN
ncbi:MAG TPA: hypothetical protein VGW40_00965 [Allosphingosinicella sp.]|nr:hypothetical protein [Allosphingosinicella sp.]